MCWRKRSVSIPQLLSNSLARGIFHVHFLLENHLLQDNSTHFQSTSLGLRSRAALSLCLEFIGFLGNSQKEMLIIILILQIRKLCPRQASLAPVVKPGFKAKVSGSSNHVLLPLEKRLRERDTQLVNVAFLLLNIYLNCAGDKGRSEISLKHQKTKRMGRKYSNLILAAESLF